MIKTRRLLYRVLLLLAVMSLLVSSIPVFAAFVGPSAITIDGTFTDWPTAPPPNPGCYTILDQSNTGIYDGAGFANTAADINYFWNAISTQNGGTDNATPSNKIQNVYYRVDTFTKSVIRPQQTYNIQLNLGAAAEGYADHLLQISVLDTATPKVRIVLSEYNTPYPRLGAYTTGSLTGRVSNIANPYPGYSGAVDANATGAYGKYDGTNYAIEVKIPVSWYGSAYGGLIKDDGTGASLFVGTIFSSAGNLGSVGTVKDTINDASGDLDFSIVNPITGETTYIFPPELTLTKDGPSEATVGSYITFSGTLRNDGYLRAHDVVLVDTLPAGLTFISSSHSAVYDPAGRTVTWDLGSLGGLSSITDWLTVQVDGTVPNGTHLVNTFSVTWKDAGGTGYGPATATKDVVIYTHPTLSVSKVGPAIGYPGGTLAFTIDAANTGGLPAQNITLVDTLPAEYTYVSSSHSGVYNSGAHTVTWNLGSLAAGGDSTVTLTVQVGAGVANGTPLTNNASVTWQDSGGTPYGPATTSLTTTIYTTPQMTVTKEGPDEATIGSYITFSGLITNVGGLAAENVVLVDNLPEGLTFISSSNSAVYDPVARTVTWNLGTVGSGVAISGWITVLVEDAVYNGTHLLNTFSITWQDSGGTPYGPASATKEVAVYKHPTLSITKSGPESGTPGGSITFSIDVTNSGGLPAQNVTLVDALPDKYTYVSSNPPGTYSGGNVIWDLGTLNAGGTESVSVTVQVDASVANGTPLANSALATWQDPYGNSFGPAGSSVITTISTNPLMTLTKSGPDEATVGSYITFTGTLTNEGGMAAQNVVLIDYLPGGLNFVSSSHSAVYDPVTHSVTWNLGSVDSGAIMSGWITVQVDPSLPNGSHRINTFSVTWQDGSGNNYGPVSALKEVIVYTHPTLSVSKTGPDTGIPGDRLTFTIDVTNSGGLPAQNVTLVDALSDKYTYISSNPAGTYSGGNVIWNLGTLNAGGSASVTLTVQVDASVASGTPLGNGAMVTWQDGSGNTYGPAGASLTTTIYTTPQLTVTKEGPDEATAGSYITFTGTLTNEGGTAAQNVVLIDYLPIGLNFVSSSHSAVYDPVARTVTSNIGTIDAGATISGIFTVQVDPAVANGSHRINAYSATWQDSSGNDYGPASATKDVTIYTHPSLSITKSGPETGTPGGSITFSIDVTNSGGLPAQNVTLVDALSDKYTYISSNPAGTYSGGNVIWNLGTLNAGGTASVSLTVQVDASVASGTPLGNGAMVTWQDGSGNTYGPASSSITTTIYTTPQMTITKEGPDEATAGSYITFTGTATNVGGLPAQNVVLVDHLPSGFTFVSSSYSAAYDPVAHAVTWNLGSVSSGVAMPGWITVQVDASVANGSHRINNFSLTWQDGSGNSYGPVNTSKEVLVYTHPTLSINKTGPTSGNPGGNLTFTIDVTNSGGLPAQNITLVDVLADKYTYVSSNPPGAYSGGNVIWAMGTLNAGGTASVSITVQVDASVASGTPLGNSALATWQDPYGHTYGPTGSSMFTTMYTTPHLVITKSGPVTAVPGDQCTYNITLADTSGSDALNITLRDYVPTGMSYVSSSDGGSYAGGIVTWNLGNIAGTDLRSVSVTLQVDPTTPEGTLLTNTAIATWQDGTGNDYGPASTSTLTSVSSFPVLTIQISGPTTAQVCERLTYTLMVTDNSTIDTADAIVQYMLPNGCTYADSSDNGTYAAGIVTWHLGPLTTGSSRQVTVTVTCCDVPAGSSIISTAVAVWQSPIGTMHGPAFNFVKTTLPAPLPTPFTIITRPATYIKTTSATLNCNLPSMSTFNNVTVSFQWGTSPGKYTNTTTLRIMNAPGNFSFILTKLKANTTYYFRAQAEANGNTVYGVEFKFTTRDEPLIGTNSRPASASVQPTLPQQTVELPNLYIRSASLSTSQVAPGTPVTVTADVANRGTIIGTAKIKLYVNGEEDSSQYITVESGGSQSVDFRVSRNEPGTYHIFIGDIQAGSFVVEDAFVPDTILFISMICILSSLLMALTMVWKRRQESDY